MKNATVRTSQSLLDISVEYTGTLEQLFSIAQANGGRSITDMPATGEVLSVDDSQDVIVRKVLDYYQKKDVHPGTAGNEGLEGIDYWAIEVDLVVA